MVHTLVINADVYEQPNGAVLRTSDSHSPTSDFSLLTQFRSSHVALI